MSVVTRNLSGFILQVRDLRDRHKKFSLVSDLAAQVRQFSANVKSSFGSSFYTDSVEYQLEKLAHVLDRVPRGCVFDPTLTNGLVNAIRLLGAYPHEGEKLGDFIERVDSYASMREEVPSFHMGAFHFPEEANIIGKGGSSLVYRGKYEHDGHVYPVAVKEYRLNLPKEPKGLMLYWTPEQLSVLWGLFSDFCYMADRQLEHSAMMVFAWAFNELGNPIAVSDQGTGGSLFGWIWERNLFGSFDQSVSGKMALETAKALVGVYDFGVVHRDVKPENVILIRDRAGGTGMQVRISDFGTAKSVDELRELPSGMEHRAGTPGYRPPESLFAKYATGGPETDVYSLGATIVSIYTGIQSNDEIASMSRLIAHGYRPKEIPDSVNLVLRHSLHWDPERRYPNARVMLASLAKAVGH